MSKIGVLQVQNYVDTENGRVIVVEDVVAGDQNNPTKVQYRYIDGDVSLKYPITEFYERFKTEDVYEFVKLNKDIADIKYQLSILIELYTKSN